MILYKYVSFDAADKIINNSSIGFTGIMDLNDPFEGSYFGFERGKDISPSLAMSALRSRLAKNYALLSLTRQPFNALMWSHYGDSHSGVVIGIDVEKAGFTELDRSSIPIQYGEVIYTSTKPQDVHAIPTSSELLDVGVDTTFDASAYNLLKRAFLYKSLEWAYEEEVRIVKNISVEPYIATDNYKSFKNDGGRWTKIKIGERPLYCLDIPKKSIVSVHLGQNAITGLNKKRLSVVDNWESKGLEIYRCKADLHTWSVIAHPAES